MIKKLLLILLFGFLFINPLWADTVIYYFIGYDASSWVDPDNMIDGNIATFAMAPGDQIVQNNTENSCPGDDLGTITKVEIRGYGYSSANTIAFLRPHFVGAGQDGDVHFWPLTSAEGWSSWIDITTDPNAPEPWTWGEGIQQELWLQINSGEGREIQVYCAKLEIRVTYTPVVADFPQMIISKCSLRR